MGLTTTEKCAELLAADPVLAKGEHLPEDYNVVRRLDRLALDLEFHIDAMLSMRVGWKCTLLFDSGDMAESAWRDDPVRAFEEVRSIVLLRWGHREEPR